MAKRISQLTALTSASLDTTLLGIDNGVSYKIELDVVADAVKDRINTLDSSRLNNLENFTASYTASSTPAGTISGSSQISLLGFISSSIDISSLNTFTSSYFTDSASFSNRIIAATNEQSFNGLISSSSQLTSSFDSRYTLSGSVQPLPTGLISGSSQIDIISTTGFTSYSSSVDGRIIYEKERIDTILSGSSINYDTLKEIVDLVNLGTGSYETVGRGIISSSAQLPNGLLSGSSQLTSSFDTRYAPSASYLTSLSGAISSSSQVIEILSSLNSVSASLISKTGSYATTGSNTFIENQTISGSLLINNKNVVFTNRLYVTASSSIGLPVSNDALISVGGTQGDIQLWPAFFNINYRTGLNNEAKSGFDWQKLYFSSSYGLHKIEYVSGNFDIDTNVIVNGSLNVSNGITGSTNFDTIVNKPSLISGSSQLTSSFDSRYTLSGSSVSIETGSYATTGSNTFIGENIFQDKVTINHDFIVTGSSLFGSGTFDDIAPEKFLVVQDNPNNYNIIVAKANTNNYSQIVVTNLNNGISASSDLIVQADNGGETNMYADLGVNSSGYTGNGNGIGAANDAYVYGKAKDFWVGNLTTSSLYIFANPNGTADIILSSSVLTVSGSLLVSGNITGDLDYSNLINVPSLISASSQLTSSYDNRYAPSASYLTSLNGVISSSTQISEYGFISSSQLIDTGSFITTASYNSDSSSFDNRIDAIVAGTGLIPDGTISGSSQISALGYISSLPYNLISSSTQISSYGFITGSYETVGRGIISSSAQLPIGIISGASQIDVTQITNYSTLATTGSNSFNGTQNFTGSIIAQIISASALTVTTFYAVSSSVASTSGSTSFGSVNGDIMNVTGSVSSTNNIIASNNISSSTISGFGNATLYSASVNSRLVVLENFTSSINTTIKNKLNSDGVISGSSQLTSSFDSRYTLSGSVQPLPSNLISSSAQITTLGFVSGSYLTSLSGAISSSNQLTASFDTRYTLSGSISATPAGTISSSAQLPSGLISGAAQLPSGIVSSSSQITSSLDTRYQLSGSAGVVPAGTISGSSQLTSSYDGRYALSSSFNSFTSSYNLWTSSIATTGSNNFNGNQVVTGSLTVSSIATISSSIAANASALTLSSGSNLYIQNAGIAEISGSLRVSGSVAFTGSLSISSGSITMPNRPAFRVVGTASTERAVGLVLSGSAISVDYNEGNYFNTTNGKFTAPIAGLYHVFYNGRVGGTNSAMQVIVYKNTNIVQFMWETAGNTGATHFGVSGIVKLAVNDTLEAKVTVGSIQFDANDNFGATYIG